MRAERLISNLNKRVVFQMQDGTMAEFSVNPKTMEPTNMQRWLEQEEKMHIHLETMDGVRLSGGTVKRAGFSAISWLQLGALLGCAIAEVLYRLC